MTRIRPVLVGSSCALAVLCVGARAAALEPGKLGGDTVRVDVTEASSLLYNFDNRDTQDNQVSTLANDNWGLWYNRLNLQASWGKWTLGLRVDNAWFYTSPNPTQIGLDLVEGRVPGPGSQPNPVYFRNKVQEAGVELSNRYINWLYPAKYYVGYTTRDVELTLGDFYAQLGRGFVLSVRKLDELSSDTTVRGTRATGRVRVGDLRLKLTALGGVMNPLRIDDASGRYIGVDDSVTPNIVALTEAGMPRAVDTDFLPAAPTYAPDRLIAGQIEAATNDVKFGTQASLLLRQRALTTDVVRSADDSFVPGGVACGNSSDPDARCSGIFTGSQSIEVPDIAGHGAAYLEVAGQDLQHSDPGVADSDLFGHAVYASVSVIEDPLTVLFEGKHYRRFFPLQANVDLTRAREFSLVQYSAPPTTEAFWVDTEFEGFNTCVSGGRLKTDVQAGKDESVFAWVGRYYTWNESVTNTDCEIADANENRVWDVATGTELTSQRRKSRANIVVGARVDETTRELDVRGGTSHVFYQENYARYDVIRWITGPFSLQFQGWHRRRTQPLTVENSWVEGQHLTGFEWAPHFSAAFGVEYDTNPRTAPTYFNGQLAWRFDSASSVSLFVGQRRGALRCVAGVCRVFPPFEGARLDATLRF